MKTDPDFERRLSAVVAFGVRIAAGELEERLAASDVGDGLDALATSLNALAEELSAERLQRARAEELLSDELEAYEQAPALFCSLDAPNLTLVKCNRTMATALGLPKASLLGRSLLELCEPASHQRLMEALDNVGFDKPENAGEVPLLTASGTRVVTAISATRVRGANGEERLRLVCRDVTIERELEEQLTRARRLEAIGRLSGGIAHDFNNLLLVVQGAASLLRDTLETHRIDATEVDLIETAAARGAALTSDLLAFARQQVTKPVPSDVRDVVRDTERMIARVIGGEICLSTSLDDEPVVVLVDPAQLGQVLLNLALNARDAMPHGGTLTLGVERIETRLLDETRRPTGAAAECAQISVADSGEGMPPAVVSRAFDPFFSTKPVGKGTGLGLAMCYGIVTQASGKIVITSEVGRGTRVDIFLPLTRESTAERR